jgi:glycosyltransferase involved in cell wall biosynthesis
VSSTAIDQYSFSGKSLTWPPVSVVVPTRDRPHLLGRAVRNILDQRYPGHVECIVVFDQTEPDLPSIETPVGRSMRVATNERAPGLAGARNTGALLAESEFVAFCDDDDDWLPDKLRLQVAALRANPTRAVATCGLYVRYEDRTIRRLPPTPEITFRQLLRSRVMEVHPSTILVRRSELLRSIGLVDEAIPGSYAEDYEWLLRAARHTPVIAVSRPLVTIHWHRSSWFEKRWGTIADALTYLLEKHPDLTYERHGYARICGQIAFAHAASGGGPEVRKWTARAIAANWREPRSYLALAVWVGLIRADTLLRMAHTRGRGI